MAHKRAQPNGRTVLEMDAKKARSFFLKDSSYCNIDLPPYIKFARMLREIEKAVGRRQELKFRPRFDPAKFDDVNYSLLTNKDGRHAWRPLQLIHPVLYVLLVNIITEEENWEFIRERFSTFQLSRNIQCMSLPIESVAKGTDGAEQIRRWWEGIEQASIALGLEFNHVFHADLTDCYGAIYTHSIAWALHGRNVAKKNRGQSLIGNAIDKKNPADEERTDERHSSRIDLDGLRSRDCSGLCRFADGGGA